MRILPAPHRSRRRGWTARATVQAVVWRETQWRNAAWSTLRGSLQYCSYCGVRGLREDKDGENIHRVITAQSALVSGRRTRNMEPRPGWLRTLTAALWRLA